jgi:PhnB protein
VHLGGTTGVHNSISPSIKVKDIQKSLDFYTKNLGFRSSDTLTRKDGKIAHVCVGFDSATLMLSSIENDPTTQSKQDLGTTKLGVGVEFYIEMSPAKKIEAFFSEVKGRGVTIMNVPKTEIWGDKTFCLTDPDGYSLKFAQHVNDVTPEAQTAAYESNLPK